MKFDLTRKYRVGVNWNHDILILQVRSDAVYWAVDYLYEPVIFTVIPNNATLGKEIMHLLLKSRKIGKEEQDQMFSFQKLEILYKERTNKWIKEYKYKSRRSFFRNMEFCAITLEEGKIEIEPFRHDRLESWEGIKDVESIYLPLDTPYEVIGEALWKAFEICQE